MKKINVLLLMLTVFVLSACSSLSRKVAAIPPEVATGKEVGNGGDVVAAEFASIGAKVADAVAMLGSRQTVVDAKVLHEAIETTTVLGAPHVISSDGRERDATNDPASKTITVSRSRWLTRCRSIRYSPT